MTMPSAFFTNIRYMQPIIRVDADQMSVERSMMYF